MKLIGFTTLFNVGGHKMLTYEIYSGGFNGTQVEVSDQKGEPVASIGLVFKDGELIDYDGVDELFSWDAKAIELITGKKVPPDMYDE